jgi:hypothetical protein
MPSTLVPMFAETWAWLLVDGQDGQRLDLKLDAAIEEDVGRLHQLANCTMGLLVRSHKKEVARDTCSAMGALGRAAKEMLPLMQRIADWLVQTTEEWGGYPEVAHEGLTALVDMCKTRSELLGLDLSREHAGHVWKDTLAQHLELKAMGLAHNFVGRSDFHADMIKPAFRLLAHTHPLHQVVRFICGSKNRPLGEMLSCVLDEIYSNLRPAIQEWTKFATSRARAAKAKVLDETEDGKNNWASNVLVEVQKLGGVGLEALKVLSPALAEGASCEAWQDLEGPSKGQLLVDWAKGSSPHEYQDRFFLAGLLFDARALLPNLMLVDLNCLEPLEPWLKLDVARCILRIPAPQVPSSCIVWVKVIGATRMSSNDSAEGEWVIPDWWVEWEVRAGWDVATAIWQGVDREGWSAWASVLRAALSVLNRIPNSDLAAELDALKHSYNTHINNDF